MIKLNKQTSVTGACLLTIDGKEEQVAFMNANIPVSGTPNISRAIQNVELFKVNKDEVLKDFEAFDRNCIDTQQHHIKVLDENADSSQENG